MNARRTFDFTRLSYINHLDATYSRDNKPTITTAIIRSLENAETIVITGFSPHIFTRFGEEGGSRVNNTSQASNVVYLNVNNKSKVRPSFQRVGTEEG